MAAARLPRSLSDSLLNDIANRFLWDDCNSIEEQRARVFRRWLANPHGRYDDKWDNDLLLRLAIEFMIQPLFMRSANERLHEYWCDGIVYFECSNPNFANLRFSGTSVYFCGQKYCGFAPFELDLRYGFADSDMPEAVSIRFGELDPSYLIARIPTGTRAEYKNNAIKVHLRRPTCETEWAVNLNFDPYSVG